jgi:magnesium-transporting ATPase (P-type)
MTFAYAKMSEEDFKSAYEEDKNASETVSSMNEALKSGDLSLTLIGTFGLRDPLRNKVQSCVKYAREHAKLNVRLVSGDHIETAKAVALKTGILLPEEAGATHAIMEGSEFMDVIGNQIHEQQDEAGETSFQVEDAEKFKDVVQNLRVLARANA